MRVQGLFIVLAMGCCLAQSFAIVPLSSGVKPYVAIFPYGSAEFTKGLETLLRGASSGPISSALPYSVVVQNVSAKPLRGLTVLFDVEDQSGKTLNFQFNVKNLDSKTAPPMAPGQYRFFSPISIVNDAVQERRPGLVNQLDKPFSNIVATLSLNRGVKSIGAGGD